MWNCPRTRNRRSKKMSKFAEKVKKYYEQGIWTKRMVRDAVEKGKINADEYAEIVGEPYD